MSIVDWGTYPEPWRSIGPETAELIAAVARGENVQFPVLPQTAVAKANGLKGWEKRLTQKQQRAK